MLKFLGRFLNTGAGEYVKTFLVCTLVALLINILENQSAYTWVTFFCSYCYGLCTHLSISAAHFWFPTGTKVTRYLLPSIFGFIIGSLVILIFSEWLMGGFASDVMGWLLIALVAHSVTTYWLMRIEQSAQMRTRLKVMQLEQVEKEKALIQSQLCLLQSQMEPHFLFNTIANVKAAIHLDPQRAEDMLDHLAVLMRQSLKRSLEQNLSLADELKFCESYLAIQKLRLGSRLQVVLDVDEAIDLTQSFPSMLIQPLVENAILHGIEPMTAPCTLQIKLSANEKRLLCIKVEDNGAGFGGSTHQGHGIGLNNIRQRLWHYYHDRAELNIGGNPLGGVTAVLSVPLGN